jgi:type IV pilus assembly protein PilM
MNHEYKHQFPAPRFLSMPSCAIDISDQSIKYGELIPTPDGLVLGRYGQEKVPEGAVVSGKIENATLLADVLRSLREREHLSFIRVSLPEEQMYLFNIVLPILPYNEIRETILLQIEEHIPIGADEAVFDYEVLKIFGEQMLVQVLATPISIIDSYLAVFRDAGLIPLSFEIEAQAIARAVCSPNDTSAVLIVDFGETRTGISIAYQDRVYFTSTFDMGGKRLTEMVAKNFGISFEAAEKMKRSYGLVGSGEQNELFAVILSGLSVLRDEIEKDYMYWHNHNGEDGEPHPKIEKVILCGGDANLAGIAEYISGSLKIPVEHANTWKNITDVKKLIPEMSFDESLSFTTVLGLSLGDFTSY